MYVQVPWEKKLPKLSFWESDGLTKMKISVQQFVMTHSFPEAITLKCFSIS